VNRSTPTHDASLTRPIGRLEHHYRHAVRALVDQRGRIGHRIVGLQVTGVSRTRSRLLTNSTVCRTAVIGRSCGRITIPPRRATVSAIRRPLPRSCWRPHRDGGAGAVVGGQIDVEPRRHFGSGRHDENVVVVRSYPVDARPRTSSRYLSPFVRKAPLGRNFAAVPLHNVWNFLPGSASIRRRCGRRRSPADPESVRRAAARCAARRSRTGPTRNRDWDAEFGGLHHDASPAVDGFLDGGAKYDATMSDGRSRPHRTPP